MKNVKKAKRKKLIQMFVKFSLENGNMIFSAIILHDSYWGLAQGKKKYRHDLPLFLKKCMMQNLKAWLKCQDYDDAHN